MSEEFKLTDDDYSFTIGRHGPNISLAEKVHNKLDYAWQCSVIVKLMGKSNTANGA